MPSVRSGQRNRRRRYVRIAVVVALALSVTLVGAGMHPADAVLRRAGEPLKWVRAAGSGTSAFAAANWRKWPGSGDRVAPTTPSRLRVTSVSDTTISLTWRASTDASGVAGYRVFAAGVLRGTTTETYYVVSGLACEEAYRLRVEAYDRAGNTSGRASVYAATDACGAAQSPRTVQSDVTPPTPPATVAVVSVARTSISMSWNAAADNVGVAGYGVFRDGAKLADVGAGTRTYSVSGLTCGTSYALAVDAFDLVGNRSAPVNLFAATAPCADTQPPSVPQGLTMTDATEATIALDWSPSTDNFGVTGYALYRNGARVATTTETAYTYTGLACGTSYTLALAAYDAPGNESIRAEATTTRSTLACSPPPPGPPSPLPPPPPPAPSDAWTFCANEGETCSFAGIQEVRYGSASTFTTARQFTNSVACTNAVFGDPTPGVFKECERRPLQAEPTPPPPPPDTQPPSVPQGLTMTAATEATIALDWDASTDNVGVTGYALYRDGAKVATTTETAYTHTGLACGTSYTLALTAFDAGGNESLGAEATTTRSTLACSPPPPGPPSPPPPPPPMPPPPSPTPPPPPPDPGNTANLWVDTNGGSCSRSTSPVAYSDAAACASFNAAWQAASAGDTVRVQAGDYGNQFFNSHAPAMTAPGVTFRASGGTVTVGVVDIGDDPGNFGSGRGRQDVDWLTFVGPVSATSLTKLRHTTNVTFDGWRWDQGFSARKSIFWLGDNDRTTIRNSDLCCTTNDVIMESTVPSPNFGANSNITIEYTKIHSMRRTSTAVHNECFLAPAVPGLTLRGTHWWGCTVMNINVGAFGDSAPYQQTNFHWVNNIFESPTNLNENDKTGLPFFQGCNTPNWKTKPGWLAEYNVFETSWYTPDVCGDTGLTLRGNVGSTGLKCPVGAAYSRNIWKERTCGPTDVLWPTILSPLNFINIAAHNWMYPVGAFQVDKGDLADYPTHDAAGTTRYIGAAPDAGPYEYRP